MRFDIRIEMDSLFDTPAKVHQGEADVAMTPSTTTITRVHHSAFSHGSSSRKSAANIAFAAGLWINTYWGIAINCFSVQLTSTDFRN